MQEMNFLLYGSVSKKTNTHLDETSKMMFSLFEMFL